MKTGSVAVQTGDTVQKGAAIAELGNTGSSDGAHLHFHVMDDPSTLSSNGMPYVFEQFELTGQLPPLAEVLPYYEAQESMPVDTSDTRPRADALPVGGNVVAFLPGGN